MTTGRLELGGLDVYYEERGSGRPVVLVHGLGASTQIWQEVAPPLSDDFRVVTYDLRGLGRTATPPPPYSIAALADDLHGLIGSLELEDAVVVGHSLGGAVAMTYAIRHPTSLSGLVVIAAPSVAHPAMADDLAARARLAREDGMAAVADLHVKAGFPASFADAHPETIAAYRSILASGDPEGYAGLCAGLARLDLRDDLQRIRVPTLAVAAELDPIVPVEAMQATASRIAGCEWAVIADCGHIVVFERPTELVTLVRSFSRRAAPAAVGQAG